MGVGKSYRLFLVAHRLRSSAALMDAVRRRGHRVETTCDWNLATEAGLAETFDCIIVDATHPAFGAGTNIFADLRGRDVHVPILILAPRGPVRDRILALNAGADDYMTEPFDLEEVQARIQALVRRSGALRRDDVSNYEFGGMRVDFARSVVVKSGLAVSLSERENRLLQYLVKNRGIILSRSTLLHAVWGYHGSSFTRTVDVSILRLRHKVEDDPRRPRFITTVHGLGYRFDG
jgi:DNA-binding response OmpR family regulator